METLRVLIELDVTSLGTLPDEERKEVLDAIIKQVTPIPMLPYGVTTQVRSISFGD